MSGKIFLGYIRTEGDKIYFLKTNDGLSQEELLFDYSILPGESVNIKCIINLDDLMWGDSVAHCKETGTEYSMGRSFESVTVEYSINGESTSSFCTPIKWIKGIGSEAGISNNILSSSCGGNVLMEVRTNEGTVYKLSTSEVERILGDKMKDNESYSTGYHIDGRIFRDGDTGVRISNGKKNIKF